MVSECHAHDLWVIYGCGNVKMISEDFIEMGIDRYNPMAAKADPDCVDLRRQYTAWKTVCVWQLQLALTNAKTE